MQHIHIFLWYCIKLIHAIQAIQDWRKKKKSKICSIPKILHIRFSLQLNFVGWFMYWVSSWLIKKTGIPQVDLILVSLVDRAYGSISLSHSQVKRIYVFPIVLLRWTGILIIHRDICDVLFLLFQVLWCELQCFFILFFSVYLFMFVWFLFPLGSEQGTFKWMGQ